MGSEGRLGAPGGSSPPTPDRLAGEPSPFAKVTRDAAERLRQMENFVARHRGVDRQQSMLPYEARRATWMEGLARQARLQKALTNPTEIKEKKILSGDVPIKLFTMGLAHAWPKQLHRGDCTIGYDRHRTLQAVMQHQRFNDSFLNDLNLVYGPRRIIFLNCEQHFTNICQRDGRHLGFHPDLTKRLLSQTRGFKKFFEDFWGQMKAAPAFAIDEGLAIVGYCVSGKHRSNAVMGILLYLLVMSRFHLGSFEVTMLSIHNQELCHGGRLCNECIRCLDQDLHLAEMVRISEMFQSAKKEVFDL